MALLLRGTKVPRTGVRVYATSGGPPWRLMN